MIQKADTYGIPPNPKLARYDSENNQERDIFLALERHTRAEKGQDSERVSQDKFELGSLNSVNLTLQQSINHKIDTHSASNMGDKEVGGQSHSKGVGISKFTP